ncbi:hypothetical protein [Streptococcus oralis]|uniref:Lipoprotein n=1 Tax=Streptococcus oralis subsp. oralis TaxID=1891914 RepID=A0A0F2CWZ2_STROR|nr:hypothetical protein [Streptococcus oralis]KJQ62419.1 hypothetical protein TZ87_00919 [Streptococcus oralis subsp. oralis]
MKKIKLLTILALSTVVLGACSALSNQSSEASSDDKEKTEQVEKKDEAAEVKEKVTKDAEILLDSVLTSDSARFKKIYGETYEKWTEAIFAVQTSEKIKEEGLSPASTYSVQWHKDFPVETPEETISGFLKMKRKLFQDIGSYTVKDVKVDESGNTATVTFNSKKLHSKGLTSSIREVLTILIGGIDNLGKYNQAGSDVDIKRYQTLVTYWIYEHLFRKDFAIYSDVDAEAALTPLTTGDFDTEIKLTKDKDGNWLISQEDYRTLSTELMDTTEGYDKIDRKNSTKSKNKSTDKSSDKSSNKSTDKSTDKSSDKKDKSNI